MRHLPAFKYFLKRLLVIFETINLLKMNCKLILVLIGLWISLISNVVAQNVAINATGAVGAASSMLDVSATDKGVLVPRVSLVAVNNAVLPINAPATSLLVYNTNAAVVGGSGAGFYYWDGAQWVRLVSQSGANGPWLLNGNAGINDPASPASYGTSTIAGTENWIGSTDANDFVIGTNSIERLRVKQTNGFVGIGTSNPSEMLHVSSGTTNAGIVVDGLAANQSRVAFRSSGVERSVIYRPAGSFDLRIFGNGLGGDIITFQTTTGFVGIGNTNPLVSLVVNGGLAAIPSASVAVTSDNQIITVGNRSYIQLTSNSATYTNRNITFTDGLHQGQMLAVEYAANDNNLIMIENGVLLSDGTGVINCVSNSIVLGNAEGYYKVARFIWNGTDWLQEGYGPAGEAVFSHIGADQNFTVPTGVYSIEVKVWGAGGGGACFANQASGGSAAFIHGKLAVTPGENLTIIVGGGGNCGGANAYGGGGRADAADAAGGGGRSAISRGATELVTAGAGGGASDENAGERLGFGGAAGVATGGDGGYENSDCNNANQRGRGGLAAAGGAGGVDPDCSFIDGGGSNGGAGGFHFGGNNTFNDNYQGGGGGSGHYGGGAGSSDDAGGGGGGSSYTAGFYLLINSAGGASNFTGAANPSGGNADPDYVAGVGVGGASNNAGGNGRIVIKW